MNCNSVSEGRAKIAVRDRTFYNEHMHFCRDLSSLWVGTLPELGTVVDGFCASGIRGIRYKLENENVGKIKAFDRSKKACEIAKENYAKNGVDADIFESDSNRFFLENNDFDFVEIDPFGSPVPFLDMAFASDCGQKERWISISATDTAVLCGAHKDACVKNYFSKPLNNEFCHENGLRILLGHIARVAARNDWELKPKFCISHRHYFKIMAQISKGAAGAKKAVDNSKYYSQFCQNCLYRKLSDEFPPEICPECGKKLKWGGPLWGAKIIEKETVERMEAELARREYIEPRKVAKFLAWAKEEADAPSLYYDVHEICAKFGVKPLQTDELVLKLKEAGYSACRTTFKNTGVRTNAPAAIIAGLMKRQ